MRVLFVAHLDSRPSMGILYLSAVLRRAGHGTAVAHLEERAVRRALARARFDVVAFSYPTCFAARAARIARRLRASFPGPILAGGAHATFRPEAALADGGFDAVGVGEGEETLPAALEALAAGRPLAAVPGLVARCAGDRAARGPHRPPPADLDALPPPDRELVRPHLTFGDRLQPFLFSRGCPFSCTYCFEPRFRALFGGPAVRRRSVESAIDELLRVKRTRDVRLNVLYDDTLNVDRAWLEALLVAYAERVRVPFTCKVRPDLLDEETVRLLARANCAVVYMGVEAGRADVRAEILGRPVSDEKIVRAARWIRKHGLRLVTYNLAAVPGTTWRDDLATLDLNLACAPDMAMVMFLQPYAGTAIHERARALGVWTDEDDRRLERLGLELYDRSPLRFADPAERRRVENLRHLFGLTLAAPALRPLVPALVELPLTPVFARLCALVYQRGHFGVLYPRLASVRRLARAAILERFPSLRPFAGTLPALAGDGARGGGLEDDP